MDPQTLAMLAQMLGKGGTPGSGGGSSNPLSGFAERQAQIYQPDAQASAAGAVGDDAAASQMNAFRAWKQGRAGA